jgi:hypothetical protein
MVIFFKDSEIFTNTISCSIKKEEVSNKFLWTRSLFFVCWLGGTTTTVR